MRRLFLLSTFFLSLAVHADWMPCEAALIERAQSEPEIAAIEQQLFESAGRAQVHTPEDRAWIVIMASRIEEQEGRVGPEETMRLYTALLAGLDDEIFVDAKFIDPLLESWQRIRKAARRQWTWNPPRYQVRLMNRFAKAKLYRYLYS